MAMHMGHLALRLRDVEGYAQFAVDVLGLRERERTENTILLSANEKHHELELIQGVVDGVDHVGLEVESADTLEALRGRVEAAGVTCEAVVEDAGLGDAFRFPGPGDITYELYTGMSRAPVSVRHQVQPLVRRFGHLTFNSAARDEIETFWAEVLGFRVSDRLGQVVWMRCDADHHGLAVIPGSATTALHHHAWEIPSFSLLGGFCDRLIGLGRTLEWGPVRHGPGYNIAVYLQDPAGAVVEVYTDLLRIVDDAGYIPQDWSGEENALNLWGPKFGEGFGQLGLPTLGFVAA